MIENAIEGPYARIIAAKGNRISRGLPILFPLKYAAIIKMKGANINNSMNAKYGIGIGLPSIIMPLMAIKFMIEVKLDLGAGSPENKRKNMYIR